MSLLIDFKNQPQFSCALILMYLNEAETTSFIEKDFKESVNDDIQSVPEKASHF